MKQILILVLVVVTLFIMVSMCASDGGGGNMDANCRAAGWYGYHVINGEPMCVGNKPNQYYYTATD